MEILGQRYQLKLLHRMMTKKMMKKKAMTTLQPNRRHQLARSHNAVGQAHELHERPTKMVPSTSRHIEDDDAVKC
jgi:hypothetical protein